MTENTRLHFKDINYPPQWKATDTGTVLKGITELPGKRNRMMELPNSKHQLQ